MRHRLRSPAAGVPAGTLAGVLAGAALWSALQRTDPAQTPGSALLVGAGVGVLVAATIATVWYGLATTRDDR